MSGDSPNTVSRFANGVRASLAARLPSEPALTGSPAEVAQRFESIFVQQMVQTMRQSASVGEQGLFGNGAGASTYDSWFDQHVSQHMVSHGGLGVAELIEADIRRHRGTEESR